MEERDVLAPMIDVNAPGGTLSDTQKRGAIAIRILAHPSSLKKVEESFYQERRLKETVFMRGATATITRCSWVNVNDPLMLQYHDREWVSQSTMTARISNFSFSQGAQAGLNWTIVLKKREGYRRAFDGFDPEKVARF
jgi:Methyladenine glycosylase